MNGEAVTVGSVWRSRDKRDRGLAVTVLRVTSTRVQIQRHRKSWVRPDRFHSEYAPLLTERRTG